MNASSPGVLNHIAFLLNAASTRAYQHITNLLDEFELNITEYFMLLLLENGVEELSQKQAAETLFINVNTVTRLLDDLENRELAKRETNPQNRKENYPVITPKGSKLVKRAATKVIGGKREAYSVLSDHEYHELERILLKLHTAKSPS